MDGWQLIENGWIYIYILFYLVGVDSSKFALSPKPACDSHEQIQWGWGVMSPFPFHVLHSSFWFSSVFFCFLMLSPPAINWKIWMIQKVFSLQPTISWFDSNWDSLPTFYNHFWPVASWSGVDVCQRCSRHANLGKDPVVGSEHSKGVM